MVAPIRTHVLEKKISLRVKLKNSTNYFAQAFTSFYQISWKDGWNRAVAVTVIYWYSKILALLVCLAEIVQTLLWTVLAERHATCAI